MSAELAIVIFAVADVARSKAFYLAAFGWEVRVDLPNYVQLELPGKTALSLYERSGFAVNTRSEPIACPEGEITASELYLQVDDLEAASKSLLDAGARLLAAAAPQVWGDTVAYFADPDGNVVSIFAHDEH